VTDTPTERGAESTWARLRRRKVVQWTVGYVASAWALAQALALAADTYRWPPVITQVAMLGLALGLPIVVTLAWYHGDRGQQRVSRQELAILTVLFLVGGGLLWWFSDHRAESPATAPGVAKETPSNTDTRPSIAVLPFENRSAREDDAYFVDGIHDDILTQLSKISALKVISRTSVEPFRDAKIPLKDIATQLGVTSILEGGVQRAGDRVRVTVQLIDVDTNAHVWAEHYDRELTAANIFAIQSEVASAIADELNTTLTPSERADVDAMPTQNLAAWEAYQMGRFSMERRTTAEFGSGLSEATLADAVRHFEKAIELDPTFALAYLTLANTLTLQVDYGADRDAATERAGKLVARAVELEPDLAEAAVSSAMIAWTRYDYPRAEAEFKRAIGSMPNSAEANHWYATLLRDLGRRQEALVHARRAVQLDPRTPIVRANLRFLLSDLGRYEEASAEARKAIEFDSKNPHLYLVAGWLDAYTLGRIDRGVPWLQRAVELDPESIDSLLNLWQMYLDLGADAAASRSWAQAVRVGVPDWQLQLVACVRDLLGGRDALAAKQAKMGLDIWPTDPLMLKVLRDDYLRKGEYAKAREVYARGWPKLLADGTKVDQREDPGSLGAAIDLALILKASGDDAGAARLLALSEVAIRDLPRLGFLGFGIADVEIHALRGEKREALIALRQAERAGWRGPVWRISRDHDANLASIRDDPEFKRIFADIERDMAEQRARLAARPKDAPLELEVTMR